MRKFKLLCILTLCICAASFGFAGIGFSGVRAADTGVSISGSSSFREANTQGQRIDMYLIAGQSNASGNSRNIAAPAVQEALYIGEREEAVGSSGMFCRNDVSTGLGINAEMMGPEYGLAAGLKQYYSPAQPACIFKTAAGGTTLTDVVSGALPERFGNWYPRSMWDSPEHDGNSRTGYLYYRFIRNFEAAYNLLKEKGYSPVVKAFCWMQGESDRGQPMLYEQLIKTFITDMREDIGKITGVDQSGLLFIMGEISLTFSSYSDMSANENFIEMQRRVAASANPAKVATVKSSELYINDRGANGSSVVVGSDRYHWSGADMNTLGNMFAECAAENADKNYLQITEDANCEITADKTMFNDGESLSITVRPYNSNYHLSKLFVNDIDVTSEMDGNVYVVPATSGNYSVRIESGERRYFNISYSYDDSRGTYDRRKSSPVKLYEGNQLVVVPEAFDGYYVESVTFNGVALKEGINGRYVLEEAVTADGEIEIKFASEGESGEDNDNTGCNRENAAIVLYALGALAASALILKK